MFELIQPMSIVPSEEELAIGSDEFDDFSELFGDEVPTDSQQILDILLSGSED
jgi:hypothetical protein